MAVATELRAAKPQIASRLTHLVEGLRAYREKRARIRQTYAELAACSDRELDDMGIHRSEIGRIAREAADVC